MVSKFFDGLRPWDIRSTTTFRVAFLFGLLFTVGTAALCGLVYVLAANELVDRSEQILRREATRLSAVDPKTLPAQIRGEVDRNAHGLDYFALLSPTGIRLAGNISRPKDLAIDHARDIAPRDGHGPTRMLAVSAANGDIILIARDISERKYILNLLFQIVLISSVTITPGVLLLGFALSLRPLRRVRDLQRASHQIASGQLAVRMPISRRGDELDIFATTVNAMIEELERVVAQVKSVTDAVAHDLRTPLTHVKTHLDEVRALPGLPDAIGPVLEALVTELDVVLDRFAALLRIAELEASETRSGFGAVRLDALLGGLCELYAPVAEEAGIRLDSEIDQIISVHADRNLLFEALSNLLDNAIKFAERRVIVSVRHETGMVCVGIRDDGPGVPPEERHAVLRRFYRRAIDKSKPGTGLGLSVVTAILHLHRFKLELHDANPGLLARVLIPIAADQER